MPMLGTYLGASDHELVERVMKVAAEVGVPKLRVGPPSYDGTRPYPELFDQALRDYAVVARLAAEYRVQACVEMHMNLITPSAGLTHRLVSNFDPKHVGVIFDAGNMVMEGYEQYQMGLELLGPYLSHVHVKNMFWVRTGEGDGVAQWQARMAPILQGQTNWKVVVAALRRVGYDGWLSFEDFSEGETKPKLIECAAYLKGLEAAP